MPKELRCGDLMPGCPAVIRGEDEEAIVRDALEHAKSEHNVAHVDDSMTEKIRQAIRSD